jgi:hypothetical protein
VRGHGKEWIWIGRVEMERIPGPDQVTDMWESDEEEEEDGVGDGQVVLRGEGGGG